jgi:hypothetical protein
LRSPANGESLVLGMFLDPFGQELLESLMGSTSLPAIKAGVDSGGEKMCCYTFNITLLLNNSRSKILITIDNNEVILVLEPQERVSSRWWQRRFGLP